METETTPIKKTADKTAYMREYKRKKYVENPDLIKGKNKAYYYKHKLNISTEEMKKYDTLLPSVIKIRQHLEEIKKTKPELIQEIIAPFLL